VVPKFKVGDIIAQHDNDIINTEKVLGIDNISYNLQFLWCGNICHTHSIEYVDKNFKLDEISMLKKKLEIICENF
jgi:hypothetical protein